jgi:predicted chitinase
MVNDLNRVLFKYEINTIERIRYFLAQVQHESGKGKTLIEQYNGNSPEEYFSNRDFRPEYEHTYAGDGARYRGAGYMQLT